MNLQSHPLAELFSARLSCAPTDAAAAAVLGPRMVNVCTALGAPLRDWWQIGEWAPHLADARVRDTLGAYIDVLVADRCVRLGDDLVSELVVHEVDGDGFTADEIRTLLVDFVQAATQPV